MKIESGWCFYTADFSRVAMGSSDKGHVTLIRNAAGRKAWHSLPESVKEDDTIAPPLFVCGAGVCLEDAVISANLLAAHSIPLPTAQSTEK